VSPELSSVVAARIRALNDARVVERIWARDHTVWKPDPTEISNRLAWLDMPAEMPPRLPEIEEFAAAAVADGFRFALLLGMGGSSLGPEVLSNTFAGDRLELRVLDSTDPDQIRETESKLDLERTLVIASSKSGTTLETMSQLAYFWGRIGKGSQFCAITDPGSPLQALGEQRNFRKVFLNTPNLGGRFSVLSHFGILPAVLCGAPAADILAEAASMADLCRRKGESNPGLQLGVALAEAALAGKDKCTLVLPPRLATLGWWIEQLVAESTGKEGKGILPVEGERLSPTGVYGDDRVFVAYEGSSPLDALEAAGHPVIRLEPAGLGGEFFRWEFATAVACAVLRVQPFDQPNVQEAKDAAARVLGGHLPDVAPWPLGEVLAAVGPGDYIAVNAFVSRNAANQEALERVRLKLRDRFRVATTLGFGPRFLHSTGQLHKGGPASGVFIEVVHQPAGQIAVPGESFTFGEFEAAQALGDLAALLERGRRACRVELSELEPEVDRLLASEKA
jgi:hypothetical protein